MSKTRLRFTTLVAAGCFALATLGSAQTASNTSTSPTGYPNDAQAAQNTPTQAGPSSGHARGMQSGSAAGISPATQHFLDHMAKDSSGEVQIAQMMQSKTSNDQVKQFAQKLQQDHEQMDQQMQSTMSQLGMTMPQGMTPEQHQLQSKIQSMSGAQLDKAFVDAQVRDHQKDVREVQQRMNSVQNDQVKQLLQQALPILQQHLQMAKQLQSQLGSSGK